MNEILSQQTITEKMPSSAFDQDAVRTIMESTVIQQKFAPLTQCILVKCPPTPSSRNRLFLLISWIEIPRFYFAWDGCEEILMDIAPKYWMQITECEELLQFKLKSYKNAHDMNWCRTLRAGPGCAAPCRVCTLQIVIFYKISIQAQHSSTVPLFSCTT